MIKSGLSLVVATSDGNFSWPLTSAKSTQSLASVKMPIPDRSRRLGIPFTLAPALTNSTLLLLLNKQQLTDNYHFVNVISYDYD